MTELLSFEEWKEENYKNITKDLTECSTPTEVWAMGQINRLLESQYGMYKLEITNPEVYQNLLDAFHIPFQSTPKNEIGESK